MTFHFNLDAPRLSEAGLVARRGTLSLSGWAIYSDQKIRRLRVFVNEREIVDGEYGQSRQDVQENLRSNGLRPEANSGFKVHMPFFPEAVSGKIILHFEGETSTQHVAINYQIEEEGAGIPEEVRIVDLPYSLRSVEDVRSIAVLKLDHVGDFIIALPYLKGLREFFPKARLTLIVGTWNVELADTVGVADEIIGFDYFQSASTVKGALTEENLSALIAGVTFDLAIDFRILGDTRFLLRQLPSRAYAGFASGDAAGLDIAVHFPADEAYASFRNRPIDAYMHDLLCAIKNHYTEDGEALHQAFWRDLANALPAPGYDLPPEYAVIHPCAGNEAKQWELEKYLAVARHLHERHGIPSVLVGQQHQQKVDSLLIDHPYVTDLVGGTSLLQLAAIIRASRLFIGCDSGPRHLAISCGVPALGIFSGINDYTLWGSQGRDNRIVHKEVTCAPCYIDSTDYCHRNFACIRTITAEAVFPAVDGLLANNSR